MFVIFFQQETNSNTSGYMINQYFYFWIQAGTIFHSQTEYTVGGGG